MCGSHMFDRRIHRGQPDPGVGRGIGPARDQPKIVPLRDQRRKISVARGEILRAMIKACFAEIGLDPPRRHAPARPARLVKQRDLMPIGREPIGAGKPGDPRADDRNFLKRH